MIIIAFSRRAKIRHLVQMFPIPFHLSKNHFFSMDRVTIKVEYLLRASPVLLYQFFTSPADLIRWFCDGADISRDKVYTFTWDGYDETAKLVEDIENEYLKFAWLDEERKGEYLEVKFSKSPMTRETILEITDFCDEDETEEQRELWESQINQLKKGAGLGR